MPAEKQEQFPPVAAEQLQSCLHSWELIVHGDIVQTSITFC